MNSELLCKGDFAGPTAHQMCNFEDMRLQPHVGAEGTPGAGAMSHLSIFWKPDVKLGISISLPCLSSW